MHFYAICGILVYTAQSSVWHFSALITKEHLRLKAMLNMLDQLDIWDIEQTADTHIYIRTQIL